MAVVTLFSTSHSHGDEIAAAVASRLQYRLLKNDELLRHAAERSGVPADKLGQALSGSRSVWDQFTRNAERRVSYLRSALADLIRSDQIVYHGFAGHLLGKELTHVLRVCVVAKQEYRVARAAEAYGTSPRAAKKTLAKEDEELRERTADLFGLSPWDKSLYDVFVPIDDTSVPEAVDLICTSASKPAVRTSAAALTALEDYQLTCAVHEALAEAGQHNLQVASSRGHVTVTIDHYVLRLQHLKDELTGIAKKVRGVREVGFSLGPNFRPPSIYAELDVDVPRKVLLVDDEKEFVLTLSERLQARNLESAVAYNGEEALAMVETDAPEVMVLDLKMPGIDGLEVLRRVKRKNPNTEVIILTGHGSSAEEEAAAQLGAFAYLHKPVDIDRLAEAMKAAYARIKERRESGGEGAA